MGIQAVDHIVIRVKDLDQAVEAYRKILGVEPDRKSVDVLKADVAFFHLEKGPYVELIMPTDDASPVAGPLAKRGEGIHSIAFRVDALRMFTWQRQLRPLSWAYILYASLLRRDSSVTNWKKLAYLANWIWLPFRD